MEDAGLIAWPAQLWGGLAGFARFSWRHLPTLLEGARLTLYLSVLGMAFGLLIGTLVGLGRLTRIRIVNRLAAAYVFFFRGTPLLAQLMLIHFGIGTMLGHYFGAPLQRFHSGVAGLSLNAAAYIAEIVRAGIQSIPRGQSEAAQALGLSRWLTLRLVILPQAVRRVIPPLGNEFIALLKDSSLVMVIALEDLMRKGQLIVTRTFAVEIYAVVCLIYLIMTGLISVLVHYTEKWLPVEVRPASEGPPAAARAGQPRAFPRA